MTRQNFTNFVFKTLIVAVSYGVLGKIGVSLAIPPGYATLIWLPSGVALIAILLWGWRMSFGIFVGSVLVNFTVEGLGADVLTIALSFSIPVIIGLGAAFQALLGAWLLKKFADFPNQLNDERSIFLFLLWGGAVACMFNPAWSTTALLLMGKIQGSEYLTNIATWWVGDVVGVFVAAPVLLVWTFFDKPYWFKRALTVTMAALTAFALTVLIVGMSATWERQRLQLQFGSVADLAGISLTKTFKEHIEILNYMEGFASSTDEMTRADFKQFSQRFLDNIDGLQALSWNPYIIDADRAQFEAQVRAEGFKDFSIVERNENGDVVPASMRRNYVSVKFIEPFDDNLSAFGFDVGSNPARRAAFEKALNTGKIVATKRITLVQESGEQFGVLAFMPVYSGRETPRTLEARREKILGFMVGVFRGGDIATTALSDYSSGQFVVRINDSTASSGEQFLFENLPEDQGVRVLNEQGIFGGAENLTKVFDINFGGRNWNIEIFPTKEFVAQNRQRDAWLVMVAGLGLTSIVGIFVLLVSGREERLNDLVRERTRDLVFSERRLEQAQKIASIGNWEYDIQREKFWSSQEVQNIVGVSSVPTDAAIDFLSDFFHPIDRARVRKNLRLESLVDGPTNFEYQIIRHDGKVLDIIQHAELVMYGDVPAKVVGTVQDITELRKLDRLKTDFVATVSHELRTPLTSIKGALGILNAGVIGGLPDKAKELISIADANSQRLAQLVDDLLDINGIMSGNLALEPVDVDLAELVQQAVMLNQHYATQHKATIVIDDNSETLGIYADKKRLMQVLTNLLSNAAKFSANPGRVDVLTTQKDGFAQIFVKDDGAGVPKSFHEKIFGRFSQADASETRQQGGAGLGLFISKEIVEAMGGKIGFHSFPGQGATFWIELPLNLNA